MLYTTIYYICYDNDSCTDDLKLLDLLKLRVLKRVLLSLIN